MRFEDFNHLITKQNTEDTDFIINSFKLPV